MSPGLGNFVWTSLIPMVWVERINACAHGIICNSRSASLGVYNSHAKGYATAFSQTGLFLSFYSQEIPVGQFQSTRGRIGKEKKWLLLAFYSSRGLIACEGRRIYGCRFSPPEK